MFRWQLLLVMLLIFSGTAALTGAQETEFDPSLNLLGLTEGAQAGQLIEWVLTTSNRGAAAGDDVVLNITFASGLRVDNVRSAGTVTSSEREVTIDLGDLASGASVQFSVFTTVTDAAAISATACLRAANLGEAVCVASVPVQALPATGETPFWRRPFLLAGVLTISGSLLLIGIGLLGLQVLQDS